VPQSYNVSMMTNKERGDRSEAAFTLTLVKYGYTVLTPIGQNHRYDVVIEWNDGSFKKVQCKTGRLEREGTVLVFNACSNPWGLKRTNYRGQADYFGVYCPEIDRSFLIPVGDAGVSSMQLRLGETKNNQQKGVRFAKDYELNPKP